MGELFDAVVLAIDELQPSRDVPEELEVNICRRERRWLLAL